LARPDMNAALTQIAQAEPWREVGKIIMSEKNLK